MSIQKTTYNAEAKEDRIKELTKENELLFEQLHVVQEELEKYYHMFKDCEQIKGINGDAAGSCVVIPPKVSEALAENLKLRALVAQQRVAMRVISTNSLAARLGEMLIKGVSSVGLFISLPIRLRRMWKALDQTVPPTVLGGKSFQKVLDAHAVGGTEAVEKLLDSVFLSPAMRANAYTALARQMMTDARQAADFARLAWETDPRPYRLKWLAFRLYEADDTINAEALLDMLPKNISMSASEERLATRIRQEAKRKRARQVQKTSETIAALGGVAAPQTVTSTQGNKPCFVDKQDMARLNSQLTELKKAADQAQQEAAQAREAQVSLQRQMDTQKKESDALALQTALMLKNMLTQFEPDTVVLSRVMRIVMGTEVNK